MSLSRALVIAFCFACFPSRDAQAGDVATLEEAGARPSVLRLSAGFAIGGGVAAGVGTALMATSGNGERWNWGQYALGGLTLGAGGASLLGGLTAYALHTRRVRVLADARLPARTRAQHTALVGASLVVAGVSSAVWGVSKIGQPYRTPMLGPAIVAGSGATVVGAVLGARGLKRMGGGGS